MTRPRYLFAVLSITAIALALYARGLDISPPALHPDEAAAIEQARSIAESGHDVDGHVLPFYFHVRDQTWMQPVPVYAAALFARLGLTGTASRISSVVVAVVDIVLVCVIGRRLFGQNGIALVAGVLLIVTPAHFISGRLALANVYPTAFALGWLLCLIASLDDRKPSRLLACGLCLGAGMFTHPTAVLTMPALLAVTVAAVWSDRGGVMNGAAAGAGIVLPLIAVMPWFYAHHDVFRFTLGDWGLHTLANPRDGLRYSLLNWEAWTTRTGIYWAFFSPSYLFFSGGADLVSSTRQAGAFLGWLSIPLICGMYQIVSVRWPDWRWRAVLLAFLLAPIGASAFNEGKSAGRAIAMLPFGALVAAAGFDYLFTHHRRIVRFAGVALLLLLPLQFYGFYADYFTAYPQRAQAAFGRSLARK